MCAGPTNMARSDFENKTEFLCGTSNTVACNVTIYKRHT